LVRLAHRAVAAGFWCASATLRARFSIQVRDPDFDGLTKRARKHPRRVPNIGQHHVCQRARSRGCIRRAGSATANGDQQAARPAARQIKWVLIAHQSTHERRVWTKTQGLCAEPKGASRGLGPMPAVKPSSTCIVECIARSGLANGALAGAFGRIVGDDCRRMPSCLRRCVQYLYLAPLLARRLRHRGLLGGRVECGPAAPGASVPKMARFFDFQQASFGRHWALRNAVPILAQATKSCWHSGFCRAPTVHHHEPREAWRFDLQTTFDFIPNSCLSLVWISPDDRRYGPYVLEVVLAAREKKNKMPRRTEAPGAAGAGTLTTLKRRAFRAATKNDRSPRPLVP